MYINICKDYTSTPGGRYITDGPFSAQDFRNKLLKPNFIKAVQNKENLVIDLDGGYGYGVCFLEEAFGGLIRELEPSVSYQALNLIHFKSDEEPELIQEITGYMKNAIESQLSTSTPRQKFMNRISNNGKYQNLPRVNESPVKTSTERNITR